ncbi:MAG TPA: hypothetical protein VMX12_10835 [Acidimicrobiia bacterium]|nr:hypothetical protein [Acidimicrobiia bacterium]
MSVGTVKTVGRTPAEFADEVQGIARGKRLQAYQATIATGILDGMVIDRPGKIRSLRAKVLTTGTAGATSVDVKKIPRGSPTAASILLATLDIDNTDPDGTETTAVNFAGTNGDDAKVESGDVVYLEVTAAPTAGAGLILTADVDERADPPTERPLLGP